MQSKITVKLSKLRATRFFFFFLLRFKNWETITIEIPVLFFLSRKLRAADIRFIPEKILDTQLTFLVHFKVFL